ncbi:MAG: hypothetical protein ACWGNV_01975 [Bacteroidales bacterium]
MNEILTLDTVPLQMSGPSGEVCFYMNGLVYLSNTKYHQKMVPDHISFGQVKAYFVPLDYVSLEDSRPLFPNDDFPYSPGGMSFSRDFRTVYFTKPEELPDNRSVEKIFEMHIEDGRATSYQQLPFTTDASRYLHPAVSQDDSLLVFSSDRTPSSGGLDLFVCRRTDGGWTTPVNMGRGINTSGHEWYPFLDHQKNLYFSSSGHMGQGGFDVYICYFDGSGWSSPQNLTDWINTPGDELAFSVHPNNQLAAFNRVMHAGSEGKVLMIKMNEQVLAGSDSVMPAIDDITYLLEDLAGSGYTRGTYQAVNEPRALRAFNLKAMPLLTEGTQPGTDNQGTDQITITPAIPEARSAAEEPASDLTETEAPQAVETSETVAAGTPPVVTETKESVDPDRLNFRVQILSSTKAGTQPEVTVDGTTYPTFEYYWKGAYRITVGEFQTVDEANDFRAKCKSSGFDQSFVAAFRGEERETDPSVFRTH